MCFQSGFRAGLSIGLLSMLSACDQGTSPTAPPVASTEVAASAAQPMRQASGPMTAAECDRLRDPAPADMSAASRATSVVQGIANRAACKREAEAAQNSVATAELTRIREIKEKEQADLRQQKISEKEWAKRLNEGAGKPVKEYKY